MYNLYKVEYVHENKRYIDKISWPTIVKMKKDPEREIIRIEKLNKTADFPL